MVKSPTGGAALSTSIWCAITDLLETSSAVRCTRLERPAPSALLHAPAPILGFAVSAEAKITLQRVTFYCALTECLVHIGSGEGGNVSGLVGGHDAVPDTFFPVNDRPSSFGSPSRPSSFTPTTVELVTSSNPLAFGPPVTGPPMGDESFPDLPSNEIVPRPTRIPPRRRRPFFSFFQRPLQFMGFRPMRFNRFFT